MQPMTTVKTTVKSFKRDSVFNIAVHKITKYFTVQLGNMMDRDVLVLNCHLVKVTFKSSGCT